MTKQTRVMYEVREVSGGRGPVMVFRKTLVRRSPGKHSPLKTRQRYVSTTTPTHSRTTAKLFSPKNNYLSPLVASPSPKKRFVPSPVKFDSSQDESTIEDSVNNILDTLEHGKTEDATDEGIALTSEPMEDMEVDQPE